MTRRARILANLVWWSIRAQPLRALVLVLSLGVGTAMLSLAIAVPGAAQARHRREIAMTPITGSEADPPSSYLLWHPLPGEYLGHQAWLIAVAPVGPKPPVPPGLRHLPRPGEVAASPGLAQLLSSPQGRLLRPRLPGEVSIAVGSAGLPSPDALVGYVGVDPSQVVRPQVVIGFGRVATVGARTSDVGVVATVTVLVLGVVGPIAALLVTATRLSSRTREARWAALRLCGVSARTLRTAIVLEAVVLAVAGVVVSLPVFLAVRSPVHALLPEPYRWFPQDLALSPPALAGIVAGIPSLTATVTLAAVRRVAFEPYGVIRHVRARQARPIAIGAIALGLVLLLLAWTLTVVRRGPAAIALALGLVALALGGASSIPWLTRRSAALIAARAKTPALLLAAHAAEADPGTVGRAAGAMALVVLLGGLGGSFVLAAAPRDVTAVLRRTEARPRTVFVSVWDPRRPIPPILRSLPGVRSVDRRSRTVNGSVGGASLRNFAVLTDGRAATSERIESALAYEGSLVEVTWAPEVRRRWLAPWLRVRTVAETATVAAMVVAWLALWLSTIDRTLEQRRAVAALAAMGTPARILWASTILQTLFPLAISAVLGWALFVPATALVFSAARAILLIPLRSTAVLAASLAALGLATAVTALPWVPTATQPSALRVE